MGFKTSLAVIPRIKGDIIPGEYVRARGLRYTPMVPPKSRGGKERRSVAENRELVKYLISKREEGRVELLLHGLEHVRLEGDPEFSSKGVDRADKRLLEAAALFEDTFKRKARVFVPPWELLSAEIRDLLRKRGFHICRRYPRFLDEYLLSLSKGYYPVPFKRRPIMFFKDLGSNCVSFRPGIFDLRDNGYFFSMLYDAESSREAAREIFLENYKNWNASIWCNHYWEFYFDWQKDISMTNIYENFQEFLRFASNFDIWKCGLEELAEWLRRRQALTIETKEDRLKIETRERISGLAVRSDTPPQITEGDIQLEKPREGVYIIPELQPSGRVELSTQR